MNTAYNYLNAFQSCYYKVLDIKPLVPLFSTSMPIVYPIKLMNVISFYQTLSINNKKPIEGMKLQEL